MRPNCRDHSEGFGATGDGARGNVRRLSGVCKIWYLIIWCLLQHLDLLAQAATFGEPPVAVWENAAARNIQWIQCLYIKASRLAKT